MQAMTAMVLQSMRVNNASDPCLGSNLCFGCFGGYVKANDAHLQGPQPSADIRDSTDGSKAATAVDMTAAAGQHAR